MRYMSMDLVQITIMTPMSSEKKRPKHSGFDGRTASNSNQKHSIEMSVTQEVDRHAWPSPYSGLHLSAE